MKKILALALALCLVFALAAAASADWAPNGPVSIIVSYKAGSGTDNTARILAKYAEKYVGQTLVIENIEGGSGSIGWSNLASADPDGQTIGFINLPNFSSSIVNEMGTYTVDSFAAICNHVTETSIVIVRADDDRFTDLQSLVDYAKEEDFRVKASTNGPQASNHIGAQAFANSAEFTYIDIPQGGTADQLLSLRGAEADFAVVKLADIAKYEFGILDDGSLIIADEIHTSDSSRYWYADGYEAAFKAAMEDPEYIEAAEQAGMATDFKDAEATAALIAQQQEFAESLVEGFWYEDY